MSQGMTQDLAAKQIGVSTQTRIRWRKEYGGPWPAYGLALAAGRAFVCCVNPQTRSSHGLFGAIIAEKDPRVFGPALAPGSFESTSPLHCTLSGKNLIAIFGNA